MNGTHEIIELSESYDFESKNRGKQQAIKKHSIEDDINKLFEAIGHSERHRGDLHKSAMKRPMRVSPEIGISESTSLKQALRGLCISQASEMAAVKKRMLSLSASPAPIKKTLKIEARDSVQNFNVENELIKGSKRGFSTIGRSLRAHNVANRKILPQIAFATKSFGQQNGGKIDQESGTVASSSSSCKTKSLSPNFIVEDELIKSTERDFGTIERRLTAHNVAIRKMLPQIAKIDQDSSSSCKTKSVEFSQSSKSSVGEYSTTTSYSEESYLSGSSRPHMSKDVRWEAISVVQKREGILGMKDFKLLRKIGGGDIGTVYLSELIGTSCLFAVKVMDNEFLGNRKKMHRAQTEKEILEILDHPFLPTLYVHFRTRKYSCLVMEYCPGGDLHVLRQKQPTRSFSEKAARFYAAEILLALEYLHMLGVVYRDLKPENILVREDGHIMLSDFDLSLRCAVNPTLLSSSSPVSHPPKKTSTPFSNSSCIDPFCLKPSFQLSCFLTKTRKLKTELATQVLPLPQLVVEPITARSNSFVGTHEYLAPEIIKGEGHGSAVDWWTFGIFLYELLHGKTPFKGTSNEETISNVVSESLKFPECSMASSHARDLIHGLLKKEPENRLGFAKGATEIKKHPFFEGLNWALIRCETPPEMPRWFDLEKVVPDKGSDRVSKKGKYMGALEFENERDEMEFEMF